MLAGNGRDSQTNTAGAEQTRDALRGLVHELRTPLAVVLGCAETLARPDIGLPDEARIFADRLMVNARRLNRAFADLMDLDRLANGGLPPRRRPTDVGNLLGEIAAGIDLEGHILEIEVARDATVTCVDPSQATRIVENLLTNAVRHTPPGATISLRAYRDGDGVLFVVDDTGPGVPDELKQSIFEPFVRGPSAAPDRGTGIGLSLVRRFAEMHGGRAWVQDRPGGGASFRASLPSWPRRTAARVLLATPPQNDESRVEDPLREAGFEVMLCAGTGELPMRSSCPLVEGGTCTLGQGADVLVFARDLARPENREVLDTYRTLQPEMAVIAQAGPDDHARYGSLLSDCIIVPGPLDGEHLIPAVREALKTRDQR